MSEPLLDVAATVAAERPAGFRRVGAQPAARGHAHVPVFLDVAARTSQETADALGVAVGQIAKSVIFRSRADDVAVLVVTSGDRRVDEKKVAAAGHPNGVFRSGPAELAQLTGAPVHDVVQPS